jgi:CTP:molybdopterin cytidylyltransferase MocA
MSVPLIPGLVLAAGRSIRMGRPKALLPAGAADVTFVRRIVEVLLSGGVADVLVVGRPDDEALRAEVDRIGAHVGFVENASAESGQLSSLQAGLAVADRPGVRAVLVTPVDQPSVEATTVAALLAAWTSSQAPIVRATYRGRHGHPVIFSRAVFDDLRHADPAVGAKQVVRAHEAATVDVDVDDPGVVLDVDVPGDYERLYGEALPPH